MTVKFCIHFQSPKGMFDTMAISFSNNLQRTSPVGVTDDKNPKIYILLWIMYRAVPLSISFSYRNYTFKSVICAKWRHYAQRFGRNGQKVTEKDMMCHSKTLWSPYWGFWSSYEHQPYKLCSFSLINIKFHRVASLTYGGGVLPY